MKWRRDGMNQKIEEVLERLDTTIVFYKKENDALIEMVRQIQARLEEPDVLHLGYYALTPATELIIYRHRLTLTFNETDSDSAIYRIEEIDNLFKEEFWHLREMLRGILVGKLSLSPVPCEGRCS